MNGGVTDTAESRLRISPNMRRALLMVLAVAIVLLWGIFILWLDVLRGDAACVFGCPDPPDLSTLVEG